MTVLRTELQTRDGMKRLNADAYMAVEKRGMSDGRIVLHEDAFVSMLYLERRRAEDAVAEQETALFDTQAAVDKAAAQWRASGGPVAALTSARTALVRAQDELVKRKDQLRGIEAPLLTPNEAQTTSARGDLALARVNLEKLKIRAPIDGTVLQININPGELAAPSALQPLLSIADRLLVINFGQKLAEGEPRAVMDDAQVRRVYMGMEV